jgi:glycosyltransferase involved in cell wall biosynthesis
MSSRKQQRTIRVCYPFVGDSVGGAQISTLALMRALPPCVKPVVVLHGEGTLSHLFSEEGIAVHYLALSHFAGQQRSPRRQVMALVAATAKLWLFLRHHNIDIVHTQDGRMHATWWLAAQLAGIPQIWHQRSIFVKSRLLRFMVMRVGAVVANSNIAAASLPQSAAKRAKVIYNPVDKPISETGSKRDAIRRKAEEDGGKLPEETIIVAAVGNLRAVKQPQLLAASVVAAARLSRRPFLLVIFGADQEGWLSRISKTIESADGMARLVNLGFRHPIQLWLKGCDILVAASNGDAFGRTLVEAMSAGIPVVAVDAGGHGETVTSGENGLLVADGDPVALANAIVQVCLDATLAKRLVDAGRKRARDFESDAHAQQVLHVYRDAMRRRS